MTRINIYSRLAEFDLAQGDTPALEGWFDDAKATKYVEATEWDGSNHISVATGSQWEHQLLYRTAKGRWVLNCYSNWQGVEETYAFVTPERAREWLLLNHEDDAVTQYFGEIEEGVGPGRPEIGPASTIRIGAELTDLADKRAGEDGISRAELIRRAVRAYVA